MSYRPWGRKESDTTERLSLSLGMLVPYARSDGMAFMLHAKALLSCLTLCDPVDYTVHGILRATILEWVAFPFSRASSQPRDPTRSLTLQADSLPAEPQGKPKNTGVGSLSLLQRI